MPTLRNKTLRGLGWMAFSQVTTQVARFGFVVALARLLSPAEFGLWGMALVFTGFAALLGDIGLGAALIQRPTVEDRHLNTAFWANLGTGIFFSALMALLSLPLSHAYGDAQLAPILAVASIEFSIKAVSVVHRVLLVRNMDFRAMALQETAAVFIAGLCACLLAASGWGTWSLVAQNLIAAAIISAWLMHKQRWRPSWTFDGASLKEMLGFSLHLQGFNLLNYWLRNLDKFLVGRMLGEAMLGLYTRAYTTMLLPQSQITGTLERVMWPALARCAHDRVRLQDAYLRALMMICFIGFPCMAGLAVTAGDFVASLYGPQWSGSVRTLQWLCVAGFVQTPAATVGWLYLATGRTRRLLVWSLLSAALIIPAMLVGAAQGSIEAMAAWYTASAVLLAPASFLFVAPVAGISFLRVVRTILPGAAAAIVMGWAVHLMMPLWESTIPLIRLMVSTALGATIYLILSFRTAAFAEAVNIIRNRPPPAPKSPAP